MKARRAFTLIEFLIVVAVLVLLAALLLPQIHRAKELGRRTVCGNNMRVFNSSILMYASDHNGIADVQKSDEAPKWAPHLAPYYGKSPDAVNQPWRGEAGCPNWRKGFANIAFAPNVVRPNGLICGAPNDNLDMIRNPGTVFLTTASVYGYQPAYDWGRVPNGDSVGGISDDIMNCSTGLLGKKGWSVYPRHYGQGLNFAFVDGHVAWYDAARDDNMVRTFLPNEPRKRD